ncbi:hypothetical protein OCS_00726 [Ophiocordyceps sinensis CO18]|uniref:Uncharacterized protein n=1 Tax=Ophiocordyceps sinensis (strain Co18 / CGMCC 3.14243) TaxID=911162 RepID=T5ADN9_OPHSC|nr:hypothetical protein OCS_00726 [Ophiocordyceps sinensis CO18]
MSIPISTIRTQVRQEFERNRFVSRLPIVDVLLFKSHAEYQVRVTPAWKCAREETRWS